MYSRVDDLLLVHELQMIFCELFVVDSGRCSHHSVVASNRLWKGNDISDVGCTNQQRDEAIETECDATVWWTPQGKAFQQMPKSVLNDGWIAHGCLQNAPLHCWVMDSDGPSPYFVTS